MLKKLILLLAITSFSACQCDKNLFQIKGEVPKEITGKVFLFEYKNREFIPKDSVEISDGKFEFKGVVSEPLVYTLRLNDLRKRADFFLENSTLQINLDINWDIKHISGTENTLFFNQCQEAYKKQNLSLENLIQNHKTSPITAYFISKKAYLYDYEKLKELRNSLSPSLNTNSYVQEIDKTLEQLEKIQPNRPAPDIIAQTPDGTTIKLSDLKGKIVLIDFWASWCPDCRKGNTGLVNLYQKYKDRNFTILGISIDKNKNNWKQAIEKDNLTWHQGIIDGEWQAEAIKTYAIRWLPTSILVDENGIILARSIDNKQIETYLETSILKE